MVLTPQQAREQTRQRDEPQRKALEQLIDAILQKKYGGEPISIPEESLSGVSSHIRKQVLKEYETAGWKVQYGGHQREGYYYTFKGTNSTNGGGY